MKELLNAIKNVREQVGPMSKDNKVAFGNTKYKYFDINQMIEKMDPYLDGQGLVVIHRIANNELVTEVVHVETEQAIQSSIRLHTDKPQDVGSEITYYRRYNLQAIFNLQAEDDDAVRTRPDYKAQTATQQPKPGSNAPAKKDTLTKEHKNWDRIVGLVSEGKLDKDKILTKYSVTEEVFGQLERASNKILL